MPFSTHPPETDLILDLPGPGEAWDPHTIYTHYFGFCVPEANLGAFLYIRYQPAFPLSQGGVCIFRGTDNVQLLDIDYLDYEMTMPWPTIEGQSIQTANGLKIEFLELGTSARVTYRSDDGATHLDVRFDAVTPLLARGHIMPGEEHRQDGQRAPGGTEQFMRCVGDLTLEGERFDVDCFYPRDRSWRQVRVEKRGAVPVPPVGWSPMYFGEDLIFNQISFEHPDTDPAWAGVYEVPAGAPTHHFAWVVVDGEVRAINTVRRTVLERHPQLHMATRQEVEGVDDTGRVHRFKGEAIAAAALPAWPNTSFHDSVFRWEDEQGRVTHCTYQEIWFDKYQLKMKRASLAPAGA